MISIDVLSDMIAELLIYLKDGDELASLPRDEVRLLLLDVDMLSEKIWDRNEAVLIKLGKQISEKAMDLVGFEYDLDQVIQQINSFSGGDHNQTEQDDIHKLDRQLNELYDLLEAY